MSGGDVLTLAEAAALLRVEEAPLAELAAQGAVPAQKIGSEWRFLREALLEWLHFGLRFPEILRLVPSPLQVEILADRLVLLVEKRLLSRIEATPRAAPKPGSKEAIRKHVGMFESEDDLEEVLNARGVCNPSRR